MDRDQVKKYLETAKKEYERLYTAFLLELATGLRRGELLGIYWSDIDFEAKVLTVRQSLSRVRMDAKGDNKKSKLMFQDPKTEKGKRTIPLRPSILMELNAHKVRQDSEKESAGKGYQDKGLVFCTPIGTPLEPRRLHRLHSDILEKAKIPHVRLHDLRHSFATLMVEAGEEPKVLQEILGHAKISTTYDLYVHVTQEMKSKALASIEDILTGRATGTHGKKVNKASKAPVSIKRKK